MFKIISRFGWLLATFIVLSVIFWAVKSHDAFASQNYGSGYYINLSGSGADLNGNIGGYNDEADCQQGSGVCNAKNRNNNQNYTSGRVDKYICNGKVTNCDNTNSPNSVISVSSGYSQSVSGATCSQTVQLDVFDGSALHGYMTWYSGDCAYGGTTQNTVTTCNNRILTQSVLESEIRGAGYPGPWDLTSELAAFNRAACPQGAPAPSPYIAPTPSPQVVYGGTTTTYVYVYPSPQPTPVVQIITVGAAPQVQTPVQKVYKAPRSLPSTGPEDFAILLAGLPIGFVLKKVQKKISDNYII